MHDIRKTVPEHILLIWAV